ncbi:hypothetical protein HOR87_gp14 [Marinomonas phage CB5A]|uniref:Uncharacterized protein n=1 Tax=Marinomonas phage CB5A TaxID=2022859 RepID=A0A222G4I9_9CAUD|nr:hypothetical protein HOR87_gp14 [Marinomonas phage CB5A]ASP46294.1 hypothetical protein [Marinomonas phage CB5A]
MTTPYILQLTTDIQNTLATMASNKVEIGRLLIDLHGEFKAQDKPYSEYLVYCKATFGLGKSSVSEWCKAARFVIDDSRFEGVAAFNILRLAKHADKDQIERAADFALSKTLTNAVLNEILDPTPSKAVKETLAKEEEEVTRKIDEALNKVQPVEAKWEDEKEVDNQKGEELINQIKSLTKALDAANELNKQLREESESRKYEKALPMLPQFSSKSPITVLGLAPESAGKVTHVRKAFREMVRIGYGEGHEAYLLLCEARDTLLNKD